MIEILFLSTRSVPFTLKTSSNDWNVVLEEATKAGVDFNTMKVTLVRSRKQPYNLGLKNGSLLPTGEGNLIIQLTQAKMKGAINYDLDFTTDDIEKMSYRELRITLRDIRKTAEANGDKMIVSIIGNYTHDTVDELRVKLVKVVAELTKEVDSPELPANINFEDLLDEIEKLQVQVARLYDRVLLIESHNLIFSEEFVSSL